MALSSTSPHPAWPWPAPSAAKPTPSAPPSPPSPWALKIRLRGEDSSFLANSHRSAGGGGRGGGKGSTDGSMVRRMTEPSEPVSEAISVAAFAAAYRQFLDAVNREVSLGGLLDRLTTHLGCDPRAAPVVSEELSSYEHPTLQRAIDDLLAEPGTVHEQVGLAGPNKRFMSPSFSDLLSGHGGLSEGPVDWINVHLADGEVLACIQSGLLLVGGTDPYAIYLSGHARS